MPGPQPFCGGDRGGRAALGPSQAHDAVRLQRPAVAAPRLSGVRSGAALLGAPQLTRTFYSRPSCNEAICMALETLRLAGGGRIWRLGLSAASRLSRNPLLSPWSRERRLQPGRTLRPRTLTQVLAEDARGSLASLVIDLP